MPSFESQLQQVTGLISLPEVYLKFRRLMDDPASNLEDFTGVVQLDANLTSKLLQVVNSAYFGFTGKINDISRAVNMIGLGQLHMMVLGISAVSSLNFPNDIISLKTFWRHSLLSAVLAKQLAEKTAIRNSENLFIAGLLHEIGHLVLYVHFPELARKAMQTAEETADSLFQAEEKVIGMHYGQIGAILMTHWNLPENLQSIIRLQPTPELADEYALETALLHIAHGYAYQSVMENDKQVEELINPAAWSVSQLSAESVNESLAAAIHTSNEMEQVILH